MRPLLFAVLLAITSITASFAQTSPDTSLVNQKFYFPVTLFKDSTALNQAIPKLADQVLAVYVEADKKTYYENASYYYLLAQNYKKAIEMVDSVQKANDDKFYNMEVRSYALAKIKEKEHPGSFDNDFKKDFSVAFNQLSFRKKVSLALFDTAAMNMFRTGYKEISENLQKNKTDTLSLADAKSLCSKFSYYSIYNRISPLMWLYTGDPQYQQTFPAIKGSKWAGVVPVHDLDEVPDPAMKYKFLYELTGFGYKEQPDSVAKKEINPGLGSIARQLNLHQAAGIPRKNIEPVIVVHGGAIDVFLSNEKYKKRYGIDNPNIPLIKEMQDYGIKIIACGQLMTFANLEMKDLVPGIKQALTAQTVISSYQLKGYVYYDINLNQ